MFALRRQTQCEYIISPRCLANHMHYATQAEFHISGPVSNRYKHGVALANFNYTSLIVCVYRKNSLQSSSDEFNFFFFEAYVLSGSIGILYDLKNWYTPSCNGTRNTNMPVDSLVVRAIKKYAMPVRSSYMMAQPLEEDDPFSLSLNSLSAES